MATTKKLEKDDNDFTVFEMITYEKKFGEPINEISDDSRPRIEKIAFLAYLKTKRAGDVPPFEEWLTTVTDLEELSKTAFGDTEDEEKKD